MWHMCIFPDLLVLTSVKKVQFSDSANRKTQLGHSDYSDDCVSRLTLPVITFLVGSHPPLVEEFKVSKYHCCGVDFNDPDSVPYGEWMVLWCKLHHGLSHIVLLLAFMLDTCGPL